MRMIANNATAAISHSVWQNENIIAGTAVEFFVRIA